jgi:hypothetical protein
MEIGENGDGKNTRYGVRGSNGKAAAFLEKTQNPRGNHVLAIHTKAQAGHGDA